MVDVSDGSDVNSDEIARIVDDIDSLDNIQLHSSFKKQSSQPAKDVKGLATRTDSKKRVAFQDFDNDDPLADLLSDDDDFPKKERSVFKSEKSALMENLFGIKRSSESIDKISSTKDTISKTSITEAPKETRTSSREEQSSSKYDQISSVRPESFSEPRRTNNPESERDFIGSATDKSRSMDRKSKKSSLMEDLFGSRQLSPSREPSSLQNPVKPVESGSKSQLVNYASNVSATKSPIRDHALGGSGSKSLSGEYAPTVSVSREPRKGRRASTVTNDPLGLLSGSLTPEHAFQIDTEKKDTILTAKSSAESTSIERKSDIDDLPEWLGGTKKRAEKASEGKKETPTGTQEAAASRETSQARNTGEEVERTMGEATSEFPEQLTLLQNAQFDQQASLVRLQQQEHELRTAVSVSRQSERLDRLIETQRSRLGQQEARINELVRRQAERQAVLEAQMNAQQGRIDRYVQALLAQPTSLTGVLSDANLESTNVSAEDRQKELLESLRETREEKSRLEFTLKSLNEAHESEITIREGFYKRQISFLEEAMETLEKWMRREIERLEADQEARIEKLIEEKSRLETDYKQEVDNLKKTHAKIVEEMHERHAENVRLLQSEHRETMENVSKAKELDRLARESIASHEADIEKMLGKVDAVVSDINDVHKEIKERDETALKSREAQVKVHEENLEAERRRLQAEKQEVRTERERVSEAMQKFDRYMAEIVTGLKRRDEQYSEVQELLRTKEISLSREREAFEERTKWERDHLEALKESWTKERERQLKALSDERATLAAERAKLEVLTRLKIGEEDVQKAELESTIKAAQEAVSNANRERLAWRERLDQLEAQRRQFQDKEEHLVRRAKELETLTQNVLAKREEGARALREAQEIEGRYKERLAKLQVQLETVARRENRIATEKFNLARERIALRSSRAERPEKDTAANIVDRTDNSEILSEIRPSFADIVDPHLTLMKLDLDEQLDNSNRYLNTVHG